MCFTSLQRKTCFALLLPVQLSKNSLQIITALSGYYLSTGKKLGLGQQAQMSEVLSKLNSNSEEGLCLSANYTLERR